MKSSHYFSSTNKKIPKIWIHLQKHNEVSPVDEFHTPRYIARTSPTFYPWRVVDFNEPRIKEIKPSEYFKHLLVYKDGRFARHRRWRYFALYSLMRRRASSEGRQSIIRYDERLRGTIQYWMRRRAELDKVSENYFFTFSADMHRQDRRLLIPKWGLVDWWYGIDLSGNIMQYVSKYASEAEPRSLGSLAFSEVLDKALRNDNPMITFLKLLIRTVGEHASPLQRYCNRPAELEELSLFKLDQQYKLAKGNWVECSGENIINDDPNDLIGLIGPAVDDIQEVDGNDSDEEDDDTPQEAYELLTDWMLLAEMMPYRQTRSLDDYSARDIDRNHDWVNESLLRYLKIEEAESFIQQAIVESIAPLRIIVMAGTGKSYLINAIRGRLYEIAKEHNLHENNMIVSPKGVAAFNVEDSTIHSSLSVPICGVNSYAKTTGNSDKQQQFRNLTYHLRDGMSTRSDWELLMTRIPENIRIREKNFRCHQCSKKWIK
ncbi:hypothetical protein C1646_769872 [Rhizophagus diaphanus]|nr:hypothetical protein C1646_769872 [Rhizophagus diaphanus] [Rhizophagus sp. MUCL 43196]